MGFTGTMGGLGALGAWTLRLFTLFMLLRLLAYLNYNFRPHARCFLETVCLSVDQVGLAILIYRRTRYTLYDPT